MTKAKKPELARELSELREMYAESEKRRAAMEQRLKVLEEAEADRKRERAEEHDRLMARVDRNLDKAAEFIGGYDNDEEESLETICRKALKKMGEIGGVPLDDIQGLYSLKYRVGMDIIGINVNGKIFFPVEVQDTLSPDDVRRFDVRVERFKKAYEPAKGKEVRPVIIFGLSRPGKDADGKKEDPVQVALELGLIVMQVINENQLTPITDPSQVVKRQHKED